MAAEDSGAVAARGRESLAVCFHFTVFAGAL
jgi:hypothetical protein